jgi:hypothetical protein
VKTAGTVRKPPEEESRFHLYTPCGIANRALITFEYLPEGILLKDYSE